MEAEAPARKSRRWSGTRVRAWLVVVFLIVLPLPLSLALGWFGLNPVQAELATPVGDFAHDLLGSFPDNNLVVEIASAPGAAPPGTSVAVLWARMNETLQKGTIQFVSETTSAPSMAYTTDQLFSIEQSSRHFWPKPGQMALFYLCVHGTLAAQEGVLGLAFHGSSIAVFSDTIASASGGGNVAPITSTVLVHEFGHEIGLVGVVGSAPNEDPAHPGHSADPNDVMYYATETTAVLGGLLGGAAPPTQFDNADLADLQTVRNTPIVLELLPLVVLAVCWIGAVVTIVTRRRSFAKKGRLNGK